jgi:hypothetical protein
VNCRVMGGRRNIEEVGREKEGVNEREREI